MHLYVVDITVFKNKCPVLDYFSRTECLQRINLQRSSSHWTHDSFQPAVMAVISQFCLPASHVRLCNPMGCSAPGLPVHHQLLEFTQTHAHRAGDAIQPSRPVAPFSSWLQSFPASGCFSVSQFFASGGQSIGVSASASVFPMNIQDWFPLGWTVWISLQPKGLSRVFPNTTVQKKTVCIP